MFDHAFYSRINAILAELRVTDRLSMATLGAALAALEQCLREAEVGESCVQQFLNLVFDRVGQSNTLSGAHLAEELCALLDETPGLGRVAGAYAAWSDMIPGVQSEVTPCRWDVKELDNRLMGSNRASLGRLRNAMGLTSERPLLPGAALGRRTRFSACRTMQMSDRHDAAINGEQVDRLIRYLGKDDTDTDSRGGRHAVLG